MCGGQSAALTEISCWFLSFRLRSWDAKPLLNWALVVACRKCILVQSYEQQTYFQSKPASQLKVFKTVLPVLSVFLLTVVEMSELMQFRIRIHLYSKIKLFCYSFNFFFQERNNSITWLILTPICVMWWSGNHRPSKAAVNSCSCH